MLPNVPIGPSGTMRHLTFRVSRTWRSSNTRHKPPLSYVIGSSQIIHVGILDLLFIQSHGRLLWSVFTQLRIKLSVLWTHIPCIPITFLNVFFLVPHRIIFDMSHTTSLNC